MLRNIGTYLPGNIHDPWPAAMKQKGIYDTVIDQQQKTHLFELKRNE